MKTILIAAGTGFIGKNLVQHYLKKGCEVHVLSRTVQQTITPHLYYHQWDGKTLGDWREVLNRTAILINLAGKSVDCRYTEKNKAEILNSRLNSTAILQEAIDLCDTPPSLWINSSTATIYKDSRTKRMTEENGDIGSDFSMTVAKKWEACFFEKETPRTRKVAARISLVIGKNGGVYPVLMNLAKWGLGGKAGDGQQKFAYIHIEELMRVFDFIEDHQELAGPVNCTSPDDITNEQFMEWMRKENKIKIHLNQPKWMLALGSKLIGTEKELILKSRYVYPQKLMNAGFEFDRELMKEAD